MTDGWRRVLVTGAAGGLGRVMCRVLQQAGYDVKGFARPEDPIGSIPLPRERIITGYVQDAATIAVAMKDVDTVVHCAALLPNALHMNEQAFESVNAEGPVTVMRQAIAQGLNRVIFFSTISVVDHVRRKITPAELFDFIPDPHDAYLRSKIEAERRLIALSSLVCGPSGSYSPGFYLWPWKLRDVARVPGADHEGQDATTGRWSRAASTHLCRRYRPLCGRLASAARTGRCDTISTF